MQAVTGIVVRHTTADLMRLGLYVTLRSASLKWTMLAVAVVVLGINLKEQRSNLDAISVVAMLLTTAIFTAGALFFVIALMLLSTLARNRGSPAAEVHTYSVTDTGLSRQSASSETLLKWGGARSLRKTKGTIYVGVSATAYFLLPRRSFESDEGYQAFWNSIQKLAPGK